MAALAPAMGDNHPPADAVFGLHIDDLFSLLSDTLAGGEVTTDEQEAAIDGLLDEFRKAAKDAEAARKDAAKPFDGGKAAVQALWKPIVDKATHGAGACKDALTPYRNAKQRAKDEAARQAREEAEANANAAREALRAADDLEAKFAAEQQIEQAAKLTAVANKINRQATGLRTTWQAQITDRKAALLHYIAANPTAFEVLIQHLADADARDPATRRTIPGVTFLEIKKAA